MQNIAPTIVTQLQKRALEKPNKAAFIYYDKNWRRRTLTRADVWKLSQKFASILCKRGIKRGDVVCNTLRNSPERVITQFGTVLAGAVDMYGQFTLSDGADLFHSLNQAKCKAIIVDINDAEKGAIRLIQPRLSKDVSVNGGEFCKGVPSLSFILPCILGEGNGNEETLMEQISRERDCVVTDTLPSDEHIYMCTSGSTGFYKLVPFTNANIIEYGKCFGAALQITEDSVFSNDRLLGWLGGYPSDYLAIGNTRVSIDFSQGKPDNLPEIQWEICEREKCTTSYSSPSQLSDLIPVAKRCPHKSGHLLQVSGVGGGPATKRVMEAIGTVTKAVVTVYASTEGGIIASMMVRNPDDFEDLVCGYPCPCSSVRIVDKEMKVVAQGIQGEVLLKTSHSCSRYVADEKSTEDTFLPDQWLRLGDIGYFNLKNQLSILGRNKFAILRGAIIQYPDEIEARISHCPGVKEVVVTGVPDERFYEDICALIVPDSNSQITVETVREYCLQNIFIDAQNIEFNAMPGYFLFVHEIPTLSNGKIDRHSAKNLAKTLLNLH